MTWGQARPGLPEPEWEFIDERIEATFENRPGPPLSRVRRGEEIGIAAWVDHGFNPGLRPGRWWHRRYGAVPARPRSASSATTTVSSGFTLYQVCVMRPSPSTRKEERTIPLLSRP